jgi:hypothetical protein
VVFCWVAQPFVVLYCNSFVDVLIKKEEERTSSTHRIHG